MILKFYINSKGEKVYTLKGNHENRQTESAHYKFIKFKDATNHENH
jgi:hypothetical protein